MSIPSKQEEQDRKDIAYLKRARKSTTFRPWREVFAELDVDEPKSTATKGPSVTGYPPKP